MDSQPQLSPPQLPHQTFTSASLLKDTLGTLATHTMPLLILACLLEIPLIALAFSNWDIEPWFIRVCEFLLDGVWQACLILCVVEWICGRRLQVAESVIVGFRSIIWAFPVMVLVPPIIDLSLICGIIPYFYVAPALTTVIACAVIEKRSFSSLARSADITRGYRHVIVGALLIFVFVEILAEVLAASQPLPPIRHLLGVIAHFSRLAALLVGPAAYVRLVAIKENQSPEQTAAKIKG